MAKIFVDSDKALDEAIKILDSFPILSGDTETSGLDPYTCNLWSLQLGTPNDFFLIPFGILDEDSKAKLNKLFLGKLVIFHNAKFDIKFLLKNGITINKVWCTHEVERILFAGKYFTFGLADLIFRYFQIDMNKEIREDFFNGIFENIVKSEGILNAWKDEYINYALEDIQYLHEIYGEQVKIAKDLGLYELSKLESRLSIEVAKMELRGVWIDNKALKKFQKQVNIRRDELENEVLSKLEESYEIFWRKEYAKRIVLWDAWKIEHEEVKKANNQRDPNNSRKKAQEAKDAIAESFKKRPYNVQPVFESKFNPKSPIKLKEALIEATKFPISTTRKEWLEENIDLHPVINDLVEFRKFEKLSQFCEIVSTVNPVTKRIHADFQQNGTRAGRFSCANPNLQQIPAKTDEAKEFRSLFKAEKGNVFVGADYAGIELVILAQYSKEYELIDAINLGKDLHCFSMSKFIGCDYDILIKLKNDDNLTKNELKRFLEARENFETFFNMPSLKEILNNSEWVNKFRDYVKTLTYGLVYGLSAFGLSQKFHCEFTVADRFINKFFSVYPKLGKFLNNLGKLGYTRKYAINPVGRRRWFSLPKRKTLSEIEKSVIANLDREKRLWDSVTDEEWTKLMNEAIKNAEKEYQGKINSIKRQAGNFFPQSLCAEMVKQAMVEFGDVWTGNGGLILTIHDELIGEFNKADADEAKKVLENVMSKSAKQFLPDIDITVEAKIMEVWEK